MPFSYNYLPLLTVVYLLYTILSLVLFNWKLNNPSFLFSTSLTIMLVIAYINMESFEFTANAITFTVFSVGGLLFIVTQICVCILTGNAVNSPDSSENNKNNNERHPIFVHKQVVLMANILLAVYLIWGLYSIFQYSSGLSWIARMVSYRNILMSSVSSTIENWFIISQIFKISDVMSHLLAYVLVYNSALFKVKISSQLDYILNIFLYCIASGIVRGARQPAIELILFMALVYITLNMKPSPETRRRLTKFTLKILLVFVVIAMLFYNTMSLVGRGEKTTRTLSQYITTYFCGGLYSFNVHSHEPGRSPYLGYASFATMFGTLKHFGLLPDSVELMGQHKFDRYGNTSSAFGLWYDDFGAAGTYVMTIIMSAMFSLIYYTYIIYRSNKGKEHHIARMYYCNFAMILVWAGYHNNFGSLLTMPVIVYLILLYFFWHFITVKKFHIVWNSNQEKTSIECVA